MTGPTTDPRAWTGTPVTGIAGEPLGRVAAVYSDNVTGLPAWAAIDGGNGHTALVPLPGASHDGGMVYVPFTAGQLQSAPHHDPAERFSYEDGAQLYHHYGLASAPVQQEATAPPGPGAPATGPDPDDGTMTRWEERLRVGTETVVTGRVRLRKFAVTEEQTFTVPVTREEISIDYEELPDRGPVPSGAGHGPVGLTEETYEVVRYEERVVITKELVPVERVRLVKRVVTAEQTISGNVRREVVETSVDATDDRQGGPHPG